MVAQAAVIILNIVILEEAAAVPEVQAVILLEVIQVMAV
tara:strand:+ start:191 stop:307 length:117 start_codon:yes stop_codon:yes gene_type:complete